jgi:hypothetical protein
VTNVDLFFFIVLLFLPGPIDLLNCECGFYGIILSAFQLIKYVNFHAFVFLTPLWSTDSGVYWFSSELIIKNSCGHLFYCSSTRCYRIVKIELPHKPNLTLTFSCVINASY